ncbi:MAG: hypothetical protein KBB26_05310 [Candidatus Omnitrophica bacterium]|nr:hypothetical protein [Candidatus Omnitrophota bacterium]HPB69216.1 hypothetical protein [Candidatus Omnitrophota bacterium]
MEVILLICGVILIFAGKNNKDEFGGLSPIGKKFILWGKICIGITAMWILLGVVVGCIQGASSAYNKKKLQNTYVPR